MGEQWRDINGYEGIYQISNIGNVRTFREKDGYVGFRLSERSKVMSPIRHGDGYLYVTLVNQGKRANRYIHRLVAEAFLGGIPDGYVVNHIDYDKGNNNANNLEVITQKENIRYSSHRMRKPKARTGDYYITRRGTNSFEVTVKKKSVGTYKTIEEARLARDEYISEINYY